METFGIACICIAIFLLISTGIFSISIDKKIEYLSNKETDAINKQTEAINRLIDSNEDLWDVLDILDYKANLIRYNTLNLIKDMLIRKEDYEAAAVVSDTLKKLTKEIKEDAENRENEDE